jgi:hypothetical protein
VLALQLSRGQRTQVLEAAKRLQPLQYRLNTCDPDSEIEKDIRTIIDQTWFQKYVGVGRDGVVKHNGIRVNIVFNNDISIQFHSLIML